MQRNMSAFMDSLYYVLSKDLSKDLLGTDPNYDENGSDGDDTDTDDDNDENIQMEEEVKTEIKYENKFLEEIRKMEKEFIFDDVEKALEEKKTLEIYDSLIVNYKKQMDELNKLYQIDDIQENEFRDKAKEEARQFIINEKLKRLKDCFVMEKTPLGNVLMFYNHNREAFEFYSDNTIPYRYLETVGRKYVKVFNCRPIFVDMEEELRLCEEKLEKLQKEKEEKDALKNTNSAIQTVQVETKKSVFAKFKSYNKEAGTGRVNTAVPPKNSIPNKSVTEKETNEKILLKENANHYTYEGKLSNFNFLKKVERKVVDQKYGMSFAEFKRKIIGQN